MRVLITTDCVSGVAYYAATLAEALSDLHGVQVLLVYLGDQQHLHADTVRVGARSGGGSVDTQHLSMPLEAQEAGEPEYQAGRQALLNLALEWRAHVVHANEHHLGKLGASGMPVLVASHRDLCSEGQALGVNPDVTVGAVYRRRVAEGLASASMVVASSSLAVESLTLHYGYAGSVRLIPNGMPARGADIDGNREVTASALPPVWETARTAAMLEECAALGAPAVVTLSDHVGTPNPEVFGQETTIDNDHMQVLRSMRRSRAFVSCCLYDPFGLQVIEAALCGCSLLLADTARYREAWDGAAQFFNPQDSGALAALLRSLDEPELHARFGELARKRAESRFLVDHMAHSYLRTYERLALRHGISL